MSEFTLRFLSASGVVLLEETEEEEEVLSLAADEKSTSLSDLFRRGARPLHCHSVLSEATRAPMGRWCQGKRAAVTR